MKRIAVIGATGSIGQQTLDVIRAFPQRFQVVGLAAGKNADLLAKEVAEFKPDFVCSDTLFPGSQRLSMEEIAGHPDVDLVVIATSGRAGLDPVLAAIRAGKTIALANKESMVMAGEIAIGEAKKHGARIIPVDSEHSAIWQCLEGEKQKPVRIILTASGGPFRRHSRTELEKVTVAQALNHPSWKMGKKVTIDSATLMNKGLEIIEAHWLFDMPYDSISVLVHPQCVVHSMVEFADGSVKAQISPPDMRIPIQYALSYPERLTNTRLPKVDWSQFSSLTFEPPNYEVFPCLKLAIEAGKRGGTYPTVLCAADEVVVELFLARQIKFLNIPRLVQAVLEQHRSVSYPTLEEIRAADAWARESVLKQVEGVRK